MKTSLFAHAAAAAMCAFATTGAKDQSERSHALVFQPLAPNADCHALTTEDKCLAAHCYWCKSAAVPSACYNEDEAGQLPPAVFQCDKKASELAWELKKVRHVSIMERLSVTCMWMYCI